MIDDQFDDVVVQVGYSAILSARVKFKVQNSHPCNQCRAHKVGLSAITPLKRRQRERDPDALNGVASAGVMQRQTEGCVLGMNGKKMAYLV